MITLVAYTGITDVCTNPPSFVFSWKTSFSWPLPQQWPHRHVFSCTSTAIDEQTKSVWKSRSLIKCSGRLESWRGRRIFFLAFSFSLSLSLFFVPVWLIKCLLDCLRIHVNWWEGVKAAIIFSYTSHRHRRMIKAGCRRMRASSRVSRECIYCCRRRLRVREVIRLSLLLKLCSILMLWLEHLWMVSVLTWFNSSIRLWQNRCSLNTFYYIGSWKPFDFGDDPIKNLVDLCGKRTKDQRDRKVQLCLEIRTSPVSQWSHDAFTS